MEKNAKKTLSALLVTVFVFALLLSITDTAYASWYLGSDGEFSFDALGYVLGDDDKEDDEDRSGEDSDDSIDDPSDDSIDDNDESSNDSDDNSSDDDSKDEFEYEYRSGGIKYKIERRGSQLQIKREVEGEDNIEYESEGIFEVDEHESRTRIKISTGSGEYIYFTRGNSAAKTDFPLSVNAETNELIVTTPAGTKIVTILPDEAVANMLAQNVLDDIDEPEADELPDDEVGEIEDSIELEDRDGELVYTIDGTSEQRILGLFKARIRRTAIVSAETGELLDIERTFLQALLDLISF